MINRSQETLFRLDNLNEQQNRISYQMSTKKILQKGSDDAVLFGREIFVEDKIRVFEGIDSQLKKVQVHNEVSDSAVDNMKKIIEKIKAELSKARTDTTTDEGRKAIAVSIQGMKNNLFDLSNTKVDGEYMFSGSDSSVKPFSQDAAGKITYNGDNFLRRIAVEENSYRDKGVNGFDITMYPTDIATKANPALSFNENQRIVDQDGFEWKLNASKTAIQRLDLDGNIDSSIPAKTINSSTGTPPTYTINDVTSGADGIRFEAKSSIFDIIDKVTNALNKVDELGNPITRDQASAELSNLLDETDKAFDAVNVAHAELGGRNKVFLNSQERLSAKLTQYNVLLTNISGADLAKVAVEAKALELTFNALYSTINRTNELSLVNFLR